MGFNYTGLPQTNARLNSLEADFSGLEDVQGKMLAILEKLRAKAVSQGTVGFVENGSWSLEQFDGWFSELVRAEMGKTLGIIRNKAIEKARGQMGSDEGAASTAILRKMSRDGSYGNVNILGSRRRISSKQRNWSPGHQRSVKDRTEQINRYYGPDRAFILRILEFGRDVFMATADGQTGRGSRATYGRRGAIAPRSFFHLMKDDMEQAAQQMGETLVNNVEQWVETNIKE